MVVRVEKARDLPLIYTSITSSAADGKSPLVVVHWLFPPQYWETKINTKQNRSKTKKKCRSWPEETGDWCLTNKPRNSILMTYQSPDSGCASDWMKQSFTPSETLPSSRKCQVINKEFLRSFLRHHFPGGNRWWRHKMYWAVFSSYAKAELARLSLQVLFSGINMCK